MEKTWRWFGPNDPITLDMLRQIGVEGIVTALHDVPNGDVWEIENISRRKAYIESHGLRWCPYAKPSNMAEQKETDSSRTIKTVWPIWVDAV